MLPHIYVLGYAIDVFAASRVVLAILTMHYFRVFGRRPDAALFQSRSRHMIFAFLAVEAFSDLALDAIGSSPAILLLLREAGRLGVAASSFLCSQKILKQASYAAFVAPLFLFAPGVVRFGSADIALLPLAAIALMSVAIMNYPQATRILRLNRTLNLGRKFFLISMLAVYVFRFVGAFLGTDLSELEQLMETMTVAVSAVGMKHVTEKNEV